MAARRRGASVHHESPVISWVRDGGWHRLATPAGTVQARRVVVATNGYTLERLHPFFAGRLLPATSNIIVTDSRRLLHYWRRVPDGRLLFGGRAGVIDTEAEAAWRWPPAAAASPPTWPPAGRSRAIRP